MGFRTFSSPQKEAIPPLGHLPLAVPPTVYPNPLSWTLCVNGSVRYVASCVWLLLSRNRRFSRFIRVVACDGASFLFYSERTLCWVVTPRFMYPLIRGRTLGCFRFLVIVHNGVLRTSVYRTLRGHVSSSLEQAAGSGSAGLCANATFNLLRNRQTGLQRGRPITHPHRQRVGVPDSPWPCQHSLPSVLWVLAILVGGWWHLALVLICMSATATAGGIISADRFFFL